MSLYLFARATQVEAIPSLHGVIRKPGNARLIAEASKHL